MGRRSIALKYISAGLVVAGVLLHPFGAAVGRGNRLQTAISLVRRPGHGRCDMAPAVFSKNRDRLLSSAVAQQFFSEVNRQAKRLMSDEHFTWMVL
jgi:hypothetical protein